jgi:hypothetical protein
MARLFEILPRFGNGRKVVIIIESGDYSGEGELTFGPYIGYTMMLWRATITDASGGSVAFANTVDDKLVCGHVRVPGTEVLGYRVSNVVSTRVIDVVRESDGGAANLGAEPGVLGVRARFSIATPTVALRNVGTNICVHTASQLTLGNNPPVGINVGDIIFLEQSAVICARSVMTGLINGVGDVGRSYTRFAGFFFNLGGATALVVKSCSEVAFTGIFTAGPITTDKGREVTWGRGYVDELEITRNVGATRVVGAGNGLVSRTDNTSATNFWLIGCACTISPPIAGFFTTACGSYGGGVCTFSGPRILVGSIGLTTAQDTRFSTPVGTTVIDILSDDWVLNGLSFDNVPANVHLIRPRSGGRGVLTSVAGIASGTGFALRLVDGANALSIVLVPGGITLTAAVGFEIGMADSGGSSEARYTFANVTTLGMRLSDASENQIYPNTTIFHIGSDVGAQTAIMAAGIQFDVVYCSAAETVAIALANALATANPVGVSQSVTAVRSRIVTQGPALVNFDGAMTVGALCYLSAAVAGKAVNALPGVGNQKMILGTVLRDMGGGIGLVDLRMMPEPTLI